MKYDPTDPLDKAQVTEEAFRIIFGNAVHVDTKIISVGGTSGVAYVPKKYRGMACTVIIWPDKKVKEDLVSDTCAL